MGAAVVDGYGPRTYAVPYCRRRAHYRFLCPLFGAGTPEAVSPHLAPSRPAGDKTVCLGGEPVGHFRGTSSNVTFALVTCPKGVSSIARRYCCQSPACSNPFSAVATCGAPEKLRLSASKSHPNLIFNFHELGGAA